MKRFFSFMLAAVLLFSLLPVTAQADTGDKLVALTFDDGPHRTLTKKLLDGLKKRDASVTFFMLGQNAASNLDLVQRAYDEGHEVANHTYSHPNLNTLGSGSVRSQISRTEAVFDKVCGKGTRYIVRPPYGNANATVLSALDAPAIIWSVDTNDWRYGYSHVYNHIVKNASDGAIILCHDIHSGTISAALDAIDTLQAKGYEFVTVSELFRRKEMKLKDGVKYHSCKNSDSDLGPAQAPEITYEPVTGGIRVTITSPSGAPVYYSTDGSKIHSGSKKYTGSFETELPVNLSAVAAFNLNGDRSKTVKLELELMPCAKPEIELDGEMVILSTDTKDATIYYTLNGKKPTAKSAKYSEPMTVEPDTMIRAVAGGEGYAMSKELCLYYSENRNLFADVLPGQWFTEAIDRMVTLGLMTGLGDYTFEPNSVTTRGMMVTLLYRYCAETMEEGYTRTNSFKDVADGKWYAEAVEWAYTNKIVDGYPDNTFKPNQNITRQEMAHMMAKFLAFRGNELPAGSNCRNDFKDGKKIAKWALGSVNAVVAAGLMKGDNLGNLEPLDSATRAEFSTVLLRMMELEERMESENNDKPEPSEPTEEEEITEPTEEEEITEPTEEEETTEPVEQTQAPEPAE